MYVKKDKCFRFFIKISKKNREQKNRAFKTVLHRS